MLHPEVELDLQPAPYQIALSRLLDYAVDVAVLASPVRSALVRATPVLDDPLLLVKRPGDGTVRYPGVAGARAAGAGSGTGLHEQIAEALRQRGVCHLRKYPTAETIKSAVALGIGATILARSAGGQDELCNCTLRYAYCRPAGCERIIRLLVRAEGQSARSRQAFVSLCVEHYALGC